MHGSIHLVPFAFAHFIRAYFEGTQRVARWTTIVTVPLLLVFLLGLVSLPFLKLYAFVTMPLVLMLLVAVLGHGAYVIVTSAIGRERGAQIMFGGLIVLVLAISNDVLNYFQVMETPRLASEGLLIFTSTLGLAVAYRFAEVYQHTAALKEVFARFVPLELINRLPIPDLLGIRLGSQTQELGTVLFCDIRSFTRFSEDLTPAETFAFINRYLGLPLYFGGQLLLAWAAGG